jgi:REP element-mobilizing transposase RayT
MSNKPRDIIPDNFYHVYNRATERRTMFYSDKDYEYFIKKALFFKEKTNIKILAYCVLPNHWHFLLKETKKSTSKVNFSGASKFISLLSNSYTKYFNLNKNHSGRILQGPFKSKLVRDDNYLHNLIAYINLNHLKHKITKNIDDWSYTSHHDYLYQAKFNLIDKDYLIDFKGYKYSVDDYIKRINEINKKFNLEG